MKKKIYISTLTMNIGGVERSLLGLLDHLDYNRFDVDLFVHNHSGELFPLIPKEVNILPQIQQYAQLTEPILNAAKSLNFSVVYAKTMAKIRSKLFGFFNKSNVRSATYVHVYQFEEASRFFPPISEKKYDVAISFLHPNHFDTAKITAKKRIGWVHTDYSMLEIDHDVEFKMWDKFDTIVCVSESCKNSFCDIFPEFQDRCMVIENILSETFIREQSEKNSVESIFRKKYDDEKILLSIGRFSFAKNFDSIPEIATNLKKSGLHFRWFIIGYGPDENLIKSKIIEHQMQEFVTILGKKTNPYPYIKGCDFYIQPSRFEGKAVTVREAQLLGKPVIITNFPTSNSQLRNGFDGIVVPTEIQKCAEVILQFLNNEKLVKEIISNLSVTDYSDAKEISKFELMIS